jgi:hypothetical protein
MEQQSQFAQEVNEMEKKNKVLEKQLNILLKQNV